MSSTIDIYTVYQIKNLVNQKVYIGITTRDPESRWCEHLQLYCNHNKNFILYKSMRKHGIENFQFSIIEQTDNIETLKELESKYIQEYNSYCFQENSNGYNMTLGGEGIFGYKHSDESKEKMSRSNADRKHSNQTKRKMSESAKGKTRSEETRKRMSEAKKGKSHSEEHRRKNSKAKTGANHPNYGKPRSDETKKKVSDALKGNKNGKYNLGKKRSEESKIKMSEAKKNYYKNKKIASLA